MTKAVHLCVRLGKIVQSVNEIYIIVKCWLIIANYEGKSNWLNLGEYILDTSQTESVEYVSGALVMKNCYQINAGKFRGKNPSLFINLNHRQ